MQINEKKLNELLVDVVIDAACPLDLARVQRFKTKDRAIAARPVS